MSIWLEIQRLAEEADGPSRELDFKVAEAVWPGCAIAKRGILGDEVMYGAPGRWHKAEPPRVTSSLDDVRAVIADTLPHWWVSSGLCALSGHASLGPDYNGPEGGRLKAELPEDLFHAGFDADLKPGDGPHRECLALLSAYAQARHAVETLAS